MDIDLAIKRVGEAIKGEPGVRPAPRRYPVEEQGMTYLGDTAATAPR